MGTASYDARGYPQGLGIGQVMLFWGTRLGSLREQALIAWDYDVDLAVFHHGDNFSGPWASTKRQLQALGYVCTQHSPQKYRISPKNLAAWKPWQELYQETREQNQGLGRAALSQQIASLWRQGTRARQPHGSNCVDIETYCVCPDKPLKLLGSA